MADQAKQVDFLFSGYRHPTTDEVLAGGKVYTYLDGTSTLSALWTDKDKGGVATNPIILDSSGKAEVYGDDVYKFEIYDSDDVLIETLNGLEYISLFTQDLGLDSIADLRAITITPTDGEVVDVLGYYTPGDGGGGQFYWDAASTETDNGGTVIKVATIATGRWIRQFKDYVDVLWFGAVSDNTTDSISEIQAAVNTRKPVQVSGNFAISNSINLPENSKIYGNTPLVDNRTSSRFRAKSSIRALSDSISIFTIDQTDLFSGYVWSISISDMELYGTGSNVSGAGIAAIQTAQLTVENVSINGLYYGVYISGGMLSTFTNITIRNTDSSGVYIAGGTSTTTQTFNNLQVRETPYAVTIKSSSAFGNFNTVFNDCTFESTTLGGVVLDTGASATFNDLYTENVPDDRITANGSIFDCGAAGTGPISNSRLVINGGVIAGGNFASYTGSAIIRTKSYGSIIVNDAKCSRSTYFHDQIAGYSFLPTIRLSEVISESTDLATDFLTKAQLSGSYTVTGEFIEKSRIHNFISDRGIVVPEKHITGTGTTIRVPITSQGNFNRHHLFKITGISGAINSANTLSWSTEFEIGSLTTLSALTVISSSTRVSSVTINGMNIDITLTYSVENPIISVDVLSTQANLIQVENISVN